MPVRIVQFTHPGGQYTLSKIEKSYSVKEWNIDKHCRKFLIAEGQYMINNTLSNPQDLLFWGEWEPESKIVSSFVVPDPVVYPTNLHSPFLRIDKKGELIKYNSRLTSTPNTCCTGILPQTCRKKCRLFQNTDPFVFDEFFYYCLCKQESFPSLKNLDVGSIILFGSTISAKRGGPYFALDTVFVVGEKKQFEVKDYKTVLNNYLPQYYEQIMGIDTWNNKAQLTCYKGASFHHPVNGMYSFVPCKPVEETGLNGFKRVMLKNKDFSSISIPALNQKKTPKFISDNLNTAPNITTSDLSTNKLFWDRVCQIVNSQGYKQGMNFKYIINNVNSKRMTSHP